MKQLLEVKIGIGTYIARVIGIEKGTYYLISEAGSVPEKIPDIPKKDTEKVKKSLGKMASLKDWIAWLFNNIDTAPPANSIPQDISGILEVLPVEIVENVGQRLVNVLSFVLQSKRTLFCPRSGSFTLTIYKYHIR